MMDTGKWTESAALAIQNPPACIKGFRLEPLDPEPDERPSLFVTFAVSCGKCGSHDFRIFAFPKIAPDPSPYYGVAPGESIYRPPHRLKCTACGEIADIFDPDKNGYDGVLGHGSGYELGETGEAAVPDENASFTVRVTFAYNSEADELRETAGEEGVFPSDLFDFVEIYGASSDGKSNLSLDYECA